MIVFAVCILISVAGNLIHQQINHDRKLLYIPNISFWGVIAISVILLLAILFLVGIIPAELFVAVVVHDCVAEQVYSIFIRRKIMKNASL